MDGSTQLAWQARTAWYAGLCALVWVSMLSALPGLAAAKSHAQPALGFTINPKQYQLSVKVTTSPKSLCELTVSSHGKSATLPKLRTDRSGQATFKWGVPINAPSGTWTFAVRCTHGHKTYRLKKNVTILTGGNGTEGVIQWDSLSQPTQTTGGKGAGLPRVTVAVPDKRGLPDPGNDYPAALLGPQDSVLDQWGEENRECTSFVAWALATRNGFNMPFYDNATGWGPDARARGYTVNSTPAPGSVAWEPAGHVAYVEQVIGGDVQIEEYNEHYPTNPGTYDTRTVPAGNFQYIHFADVSGASGAYSAPAVVQRPGGETDVVVVGPNNSLVYYWNTQGSSAWNAVQVAGAGSAYSAPAVVQRPGGETDVVVVGPNNSLVYYWNTQGSSAWNPVQVAGAGSAYSAPAMVQRSTTGETDVAVQGPGDDLDFYFNAAGSSQWGRIAISGPGSAYSAPAMVQRSTTGETDVAVQGPGDDLDFYFNAAGSSQWGRIAISGPGSAYSAPAMVQRSTTGETDVAVQGPGDDLDFYFNAAGSSQWGRIAISGPGSAYSAPAMVQRSTTGETDVAVQGPGDDLDFYFNVAGSSQWGRIAISGPGSAYSAPALVQRPGGESDAAVQGPGKDLKFYWNTQGSTQWNLVPIT